MTAHFRPEEFACKCGCGLMAVAPELLEGLEALRVALGNKPILILSGYRCRAHNTAVGGSAGSQHTKGLAADIAVEGVRLSDVFRAAAGMPCFFSGGIGVYPDEDFLHVDIRGTRARWGGLKHCVVGFSTAWDELKRLEGTT